MIRLGVVSEELRPEVGVVHLFPALSLCSCGTRVKDRICEVLSNIAAIGSTDVSAIQIVLSQCNADHQARREGCHKQQNFAIFHYSHQVLDMP